MSFLVLSGLGSGVVYVSLRALIMMIFGKGKGLALGVSSAGLAVSGAVWPPLLHFLRKEYGFQMALLVFGGILMNLTPLAYILKVLHVSHIVRNRTTRNLDSAVHANLLTEDTSAPRAPAPPTARLKFKFGWFREIADIFQLPVFYVMMLSASLTLTLLFFFYRTMIDFAMDKGIKLSDAVWLTTFSTMSSVPGCVFLPFLVDRGCINATRLLPLCQLIISVTFLAAPHMTTYWSVVVSYMTVTFFISCCSVLHDVLIADHLGVRRVALIYGFSGILKCPLELSSPSLIREYT